MFKFLTLKPDVISHDTLKKNSTVYQSSHSIMLVGVLLTGSLLMSGCQQQPTPTVDSEENQTPEQARAKAEEPAIISDSTTARIEQFQPLYVAQMLGLQRRLQAEYEALKAADSSDNNNNLLVNSTIKTTENTADDATDPVITTPPTVAAVNNTDIDTATSDTDINTSTEVGERDLEVLKRISLEPRKPTILSEKEIIERYQQAMQALYQPAVTALGSQDIDTLVNITTLLPELFEDEEIAERVSLKSPALARLIIQHQVSKQIEVQQALDMQQMKASQQQEFEKLIKKFDNTIKDYDEQINKYQQTLKEFQ